MSRQASKRRIAVVTGSRAEFGLLAPVMRAIRGHPALDLLTIVAGSHFMPPAFTHRDVEAEFHADARVPMQDADDPRTVGTGAAGGIGRSADAAALGRGISGFATIFDKLSPQWVVVLGDRIEAFAAASAAAVAGIPVAHIHGGDRAEGIADESMRHAITKLAHLHLTATAGSALRVIRMGERPETVHVVGSPAIDGLQDVPAMNDAEAGVLGDPRAVLLLHPSGLSDERERAIASAAARALGEAPGSRVLWLAPNHDPGRTVLIDAIHAIAESRGWTRAEHLSRRVFVSLLKRLSASRETTRGVLVGNSSAGLIEAAALGVPTINIGPRQNGRERAGKITDVHENRISTLGAAVRASLDRSYVAGEQPHPYGDGHSGERIAAILADMGPVSDDLIRKRCTY